MSVEEHLADIDFRKREVRQANHINQFKEWYVELAQQPYSDMIQGQLSMLSAVLWHLLPAKEYKKLVTSKKGLGQPRQTNLVVEPPHRA